MAKLEHLKPGGAIRGVLPGVLVTVISVPWFGSDAIEPRSSNVMKERDRE
jgi:hypothetical protein